MISQTVPPAGTRSVAACVVAIFPGDVLRWVLMEFRRLLGVAWSGAVAVVAISSCFASVVCGGVGLDFFLVACGA